MSGFPFYPELASAHGGRIDLLMLLVHGLVGLVFAGCLLLFGWLLLRFRQGRVNPLAGRGPRAWWLYTAAGVLLALELVLDFGFSDPYGVAGMDVAEASADAVEVRVVAQQYAWNVHYPGADGEFGLGDPLLVDEETNPLGLDRADARTRDDIVLRNRLVLPVNRRAVVRLSSKDVIHSFGLPELRVKQDAIPGMAIPISFTPTMTTAEFQAHKGGEDRTFEIVCSQLCGLGHYAMRGELTVLEAEAFDQWLADNAPATLDEEYDPFWD